ncbi:MAG: hypothetical protein ACK6D3_07190 [Planctomycetaceae bacterium]|jgi:hypothetical protein
MVAARLKSTGFGNKFAARIIGWAICGLAVGLLMQYGVNRARRGLEIEILGGPPGTAGSRLAERLQSQLQSTDCYPGVPYRPSIKPTDGFVHNSRLLSEPSDKVRVGFIDNQPEKPAAMRLIAPMDYDLMHIVCRCDVFESECKVKTEDNTQPNSTDKHLNDVCSALRRSFEQKEGPLRIYAGERESATRQLTLDLFSVHGIKQKHFDQLQLPGLRNYEEAVAALRNREIAVLIYMGPVVSKTIQDLARDSADPKGRKYSLVSLGETGKNYAVSNNGRFIFPKFVPNVYTDTPDVESSRFCPDNIRTLGCRRLLVCNEATPRRVANAIRSAALKEFSKDHNYLGKLTVDLSSPSLESPIKDEIKVPEYDSIDSPNILDWLDVRNWTAWGQGVLVWVGGVVLGLVNDRIKQLWDSVWTWLTAG